MTGPILPGTFALSSKAARAVLTAAPPPASADAATADLRMNSLRFAFMFQIFLKIVAKKLQTILTKKWIK
jgi:hypothetical protein